LDKAAIVSKTERSDIFIDEIKVDISCRGVARSTEKLEKVGHIIECVFSMWHVLF